jgi:hypothetical protein
MCIKSDNTLALGIIKNNVFNNTSSLGIILYIDFGQD